MSDSAKLQFVYGCIGLFAAGIVLVVITSLIFLIAFEVIHVSYAVFCYFLVIAFLLIIIDILDKFKAAIEIEKSQR